MASGARLVRRVDALRVERLKAPVGMTTDQAVAWYRSKACVEFAEPNGRSHALAVPNDPAISQQWGLEKISAFSGWDFGQGSQAVVIAIIDTGVDWRHADLAPKMVPGYDFVNGDDDPMDDHGHGTHCAGIAAATTNNEVGIAGVGYNCSIMGLKVLSASGSGMWSDIAEAITYAADHGAKVISMSLGSSSSSSTIEAALNYASSRNVVIVAAAGNDGTTTPHYPAFYSGVIAVGASDQSDQRSSFSTYGSWVDVAAPGSSILSTYPDNRYAAMSGTSMAAPHVAGLAGLVWAHLGESATAGRVREQIEDHCDSIGNWTAKGRINVERTLSEGGDPPPASEEFLVPSTASFTRGWTTGQTGDFSASDDARFQISSARVGTTFVVDGVLDLPSLLTQDFPRNELIVETSSNCIGNTVFWVFNWSQNRFERVASWRASSSESRRVLRLRSDLADYFGPSRTIRLRVTSTARRSYWLKFDQIAVHRRQ
jgi:thermitase